MATKINTPYVIDYVFNAYYQLVRTKDDAILYANLDLQYIFGRCFECGITPAQVVIL